MTLCAVRCTRCGRLEYGPDPSKIDYVMVVMSGRVRPICGQCWREDQ